ncbi:MAG TPA: hypothetical protein VMS79_02095 [Methanomassiliicoccales archaeon]|nr:hypothetical protein [Methanomassiliicoccales archaeon]
MAGAYLYRLLKEEGITSVELFDVARSNSCGQKPCAWGVAPHSEYKRLVGRFLDPVAYELDHRDKIAVDGVEMRADMTTVHKPHLVEDLIGGAAVRFDPLDTHDFDRVIDATGCARAFLGPAEGPEMIAECAQYRVRSPDDLGLWFRTSGLGYEWCFPLGGDIFHVGFGNLSDIAKDYRPDESGAMGQDCRVLCKCMSRIRVSSPYYSRPFVAGNVVGVGESIGTVGPLGGDGNLYAMQCAEMLMEHWDDLDGYATSVLKRYEWMRREREALEKLLHGKVPVLKDIRVFTGHSKRVGIDIGPVQALKLFRQAVETVKERRRAESPSR